VRPKSSAAEITAATTAAAAVAASDDTTNKYCSLCNKQHQISLKLLLFSEPYIIVITQCL